MIARILLAWLHLLALAAGLAGVWARARALDDSLRHPEDPRAIRRALVGGAWWWIALAAWLVTGAWELVAAARQGTSAYATSTAFTVKVSLFLVALALEIWPATTLARWWRGRAEPDARNAGRMEVLSYVQCALVSLIALAAVMETRGIGAGTHEPATPAASSAVRPDSVTSLGDSATPREPVATDQVEPPAPSGTEVVTPADVALLTREIAMPLDGIDPATLHSNFDEKRGGGARTHQALDIMAPRGTPVRSAASGRVLKLFTSRDGGLMVYAADSSERWVLMYAHLDRYAPGLADRRRLARGQVIGFVGSTGNASPNAPHLHFAIARSADVTHWSRGKPVDPLPVLVAAASGR
ncbi:MAG TPA: M23 family metallopeptidase [Gemmatimonadaceae bacterium]|nr:M23 family metallopeptidase [Gemmatimonadaceae bacterium]